MNPLTFFTQFPKWYRIVFGVLFLAYVVGWGYTIHLAQVQRAAGAEFVMPVGPHDSTSYANLTQSLLHGHFAEPGVAYEYFHTPGYPAFAAAIYSLFGSYFAVTFVQIILVFITALMTYALGRELVSERVGQGASVLFLVNPLVPSIALYILTDVLFLFLLTLGFLLIVRHLSRKPLLITILTALCFAAAIYVRPIGFVAFPILIAPVLMLSLPWKRKLAISLAILGIVTLLLIPWMLRNKAHSGVFSFSSLVAFDMAYYNIPHFWSDRGGIPLDQGIAKVESESGVPRGTDLLGYPTNWYDLRSSPALNAYEKTVLLAHPVSYIVWHLYTSLGFFINPALTPAHPSSANLKLLLSQGHVEAFIAAVLDPWWLLGERLLVLAGLVLVVLGVWTLRTKPLALAFAFIILYLGALGGPSAQARYRLPVEPLLSVFMTTALMRYTGAEKRYGRANN